MRKRFIMSAVFLIACLTGALASHLVLSSFYGSGEVLTVTQVVRLENGGQRVSIDNWEYDVLGSELVEKDGSYFHRLTLSGVESMVMREMTDEEKYNPLQAPQGSQYSGSSFLDVPSEIYELAQSANGPVTFSSRTSTETKPVDLFPIAAGIGVLVGAMAAVFAAWYQKGLAEAASQLMEHGFHDMTIRDVEIVGHMMQMGEFTIPELMKVTKASKITVWRTVQTLAEKGLVRRTGKTKLASGGLGGRGKPSAVYVYVGGSAVERRS